MGFTHPVQTQQRFCGAETLARPPNSVCPGLPPFAPAATAEHPQQAWASQDVSQGAPAGAICLRDRLSMAHCPGGEARDRSTGLACADWVARGYSCATLVFEFGLQLGCHEKKQTRDGGVRVRGGGAVFQHTPCVLSILFGVRTHFCSATSTPPYMHTTRSRNRPKKIEIDPCLENAHAHQILRTAPPIAALGTHSEIAWHFPGLDCSCSCVLPPLNTTASQNASAWPQRHANHTRRTCDALGALGAPVALACGCECGSASVPRCRGSELAQGATWAPSQSPTASPTVSPTSPTAVPTRSPTYRGVTLAPTASPTAAPSRTVTTSPTSSPSPRRSAVLSLRERIACCTADDHALAKKQARSRILELPRKQARCTYTKSARHGGALSLPADVAWCARLCLRFFTRRRRPQIGMNCSSLSASPYKRAVRRPDYARCNCGG